MDNDQPLPTSVGREATFAGPDAAEPTLTAAERTALCFDAHEEELCAFVRALGGSDAEAEDVTQQAFLDLHRHLLRGNEIRSPRAWLFVAVRHLLFNARRSRRRQGALERELRDMLSALTARAPSSNPDPGQVYELRQRHMALERALQELSEEERAMLAERAAGHSYARIALQHGLKNFQRAADAVGAIIERLRRGLDA